MCRFLLQSRAILSDAVEGSTNAVERVVLASIECLRGVAEAVRLQTLAATGAGLDRFLADV